MSNARKNLIQVFEHEPLKINYEDKFKEHHFDALVKFNDKNKNKYFSVGHRKISFSQYVGVIQVKDLTIEILPKADKFEEKIAKEKRRQALLEMLKTCKFIKLESISNAYLKLRSSSLLDLYFDLFLNEVGKLVRHGLSKKYRKIKNNLEALKGKIDFKNHIKHNYIHKERVYCEYQKYDRNNLLNQILLKAVTILLQTSTNPGILSRAKRVLFDLDNIDLINVSEENFSKVVLDRNTERYKVALEIAKLIILNYSPSIQSGREDVLAILFDMNKLFENYIYRKLKQLEKTHHQLRIREHRKLRKNFWGTRGIKPDILVENIETNKNLVIDTKWKILKEPKPSDEDLKQMFVYNHYYNSKLSILLYPKVYFDTIPKKPYHPYNVANEKINCQLGFIDLFDEKQNLRKDLGKNIYDQLLLPELT